MTPYRLIITHPGSAHKDELLACALIASQTGATIERRDPTEEELNDPTVALVDIGLQHDSSKGNFDHHQFPRDHEPTCALSLVLKNLGLYKDAKNYFNWLEMTEWIDCRGPNRATEHFNLPREALDRLQSPIDISILRFFALQEKINPQDALYEILSLIGENMIDFLVNMKKRINFLDTHGKFWTLENKDGTPFDVFFIPRTNPLPKEPASGISRYLDTKAADKNIVGLVYPDRRGDGYGLSRNHDCKNLEFTKIESQEDVHFAHTQGFIAKTTATDESRLQELMKNSWVTLD